MRNSKYVLMAAAVAAVPITGWSVTVRDDVSDAQSQAYAAQSPFQSVGQINGASGVLIAPNWVLTAWHVGSGFASNPSGAVFTINGSSYTGEAVFNLAPAGSNVNTVITDGTDLTLIRLTSNVLGVNPAQLYTGDSEVGNVASFIGFGAGGNGTNGSTLGSAKRGMRNTIDIYGTPGSTPGSINGSATRTNLFLTDFDNNTAGKNVIGTASWLDMEGNVAPGDSGGGLFIEQNGQFLLAGIASFTAGNPPQPGPQNGYGALSGFTSVSGNLDWMQSVGAPVPEPATMVVLGGIAAAAALRRRCRA